MERSHQRPVVHDPKKTYTKCFGGPYSGKKLMQYQGLEDDVIKFPEGKYVKGTTVYRKKEIVAFSWVPKP